MARCSRRRPLFAFCEKSPRQFCENTITRRAPVSTMSAPLRRAAALSVRAAFRPTVGDVQWNPVRATIAPAAKLTPPFNGTSPTPGISSDSRCRPQVIDVSRE